MRKIEKKVYRFNELSNTAKERAISDHIKFEIDIMTKDSSYYPLAVRMEKMQTPWFLPEVIYDEHKDDIIENIKMNEYEFTADGEIV